MRSKNFEAKCFNTFSLQNSRLTVRFSRWWAGRIHCQPGTIASEPSLYPRAKPCWLHAVSGGSGLVCSITEENHAIIKAAFIHKLERQSYIAWQSLFAASHDDGYDKQMALIDQS